jgi:MoaA/NifB/PqqE/SkfB family radical SAM enzyme
MLKKLSLLKNITCSNFKRLSSPCFITFAVTYRCNLKCKICNIWKKDLYSEIPLEKVEKLFKNLNNLNWLNLTGGEITCCENIEKIVEIIIKNSKNLSVLHITTNGQLREKILRLTQKVLKMNVTPIINVSINGPPEIDDKLKGIKGAFLKSIKSFQLLKKNNVKHCYFSCTISNFNFDYITKLREELKMRVPEFSPSDLHFNIFHKSSHYYENNDINGMVRSNSRNLYEHLKANRGKNIIKNFLESKYRRGLLKYLENNRPPLPCQALNSSCFINPYGEVYPCVSYDKSIGNLKDFNYNLNRLWESQGALTGRKYIIEKRCPGCWTPCEAYLAILGAVGKNMRIGAKI